MRGDLWIAVSSPLTDALFRWERATERLHRYQEGDGLGPLKAHKIQALAEDAGGQLWLGLSDNGGLMRLRRGRFQQLTAAGGVPKGTINALYRDRAGSLWIASSEQGLARVEDPEAHQPRFVHWTAAEGLSSNEAWCLAEDNWGRMYVGTARGVDRLEPASGSWRHFTSAEGLAHGIVQVALRDRRCALWFVTNQAISRFIPEGPGGSPAPPRVLLSGLRIAGEERPLSVLGNAEVQLATLTSAQNNLSVEFFGLAFGAGEGLRYQFRLDGADHDWSTPSSQRVVNYANLSPGSYLFLVRALNADGTVSDPPARLSFAITPPVWRRWWFLALAASGTVLLIYALHRYRLGRLLELERVRTRLATDLHDDIGASLSRIAILSEVCKRQVDGAGRDTVPLLTEIADSARTLVASMRDIVWAIDSRQEDDLANVVLRIRQFAPAVLEAQGIQWDLTVQRGIETIRLDPEQRRHLLLFFKEAVSNAVRHAASGSVSLSLVTERHLLVAEVRDAGCGLARSCANRVGGDAGHGLQNMETHAAQLGGRLLIESAEGQGTRLRLEVPLRRR